MKYIIILLWFLMFNSCAKPEAVKESAVSVENKRIESLNVVRTKINDSISLKNSQNRLGNLSGNHKLSFSTDGISTFYGTITFENTERDLYAVNGKATSGKNFISIKGVIKRVSAKHLNFEGEIKQSINGNSFSRTKKTTFLDEGKGKFWRLQNKVNGVGFVDYIDIYF